MTELEQKLTENLTQMREMHKQELELYEESLKKIVRDLGESYKHHMIQEYDKELHEETDLLAYIKQLTLQNKEIIMLLKTPSPADSVVKQLQPIVQQFFQNLEIKLISSNQALIEEMQDSLQSLGRS